MPTANLILNRGDTSPVKFMHYISNPDYMANGLIPDICPADLSTVTAAEIAIKTSENATSNIITATLANGKLSKDNHFGNIYWNITSADWALLPLNQYWYRLQLTYSSGIVETSWYGFLLEAIN